MPLPNYFQALFHTGQGKGSRAAFSRAAGGGTQPDAPTIGAMVVRPGELVDPNNPDSELQPSDFKNDQDFEEEDERDLLKVIDERRKLGREEMATIDERAILAAAFEAGKQWCAWDKQGSRLAPLFDETGDDAQWFTTDNQIEPLVEHSLVTATSSKPDAFVAPASESPADHAYAELAVKIGTHTDHIFSRADQVKEVAYACQLTTTAFIKVGYDPHAEIDVPGQISQDGAGQGLQKVRGGELVEEVCLWTDIIPDPSARKSIHDGQWLMHEKCVPLHYVQQRYGELAKRVRPDVYDGDYGSIAHRLQVISDTGLSANKKKNACLLVEMWEKPSPKFQAKYDADGNVVVQGGRLVTKVGNVILRQIPWPYDKNDKFPFAPCVYKKGLDCVWGRNMVTSLIPHQKAVNKILSAADGRAVTDKLTIMCEEGQEIGVDAYTNLRNYSRITHALGSAAPQMQVPPGVPQYHFLLLQHHLKRMQDIAGVHDVDSGSLPANMEGMSGVAIQLIQQADKKRTGLFVANIEHMMVEVREWELALYEQYAANDLVRHISIGEELEPGKPAGEAVSFKALKAGRGKVSVTPGSGMPKDPEGEQLQLDKMFEMGALGDPKTPGAVETYLELCQTIRTSQIVGKVVQRMQRDAAQSPTPQQAALMKSQMDAQAAAQAQESEQAHEAATAAASASVHVAQIRAESEAQVQTRDQEFQQKMELQREKQDHEASMGHAAAVVPALSFSAKMDPAGVVDAEEKFLGIDGKVPPVPTPAPAGKKPAASGTKK